MTLQVTNSEIKILNSIGTTKFTSSDKLVYVKHSQTGTINISAARVVVPFIHLTDKDFLVLSITINSGTGVAALVNANIGIRQPANHPIGVDFYGRINGTAPVADLELLHAGAAGGSLHFKTMRYDQFHAVVDGTTTNNITYNAKVLSYL